MSSPLAPPNSCVVLVLNAGCSLDVSVMASMGVSALLLSVFLLSVGARISGLLCAVGVRMCLGIVDSVVVFTDAHRSRGESELPSVL